MALEYYYSNRRNDKFVAPSFDLPKLDGGGNKTGQIFDWNEND